MKQARGELRSFSITGRVAALGASLIACAALTLQGGCEPEPATARLADTAIPAAQEPAAVAGSRPPREKFNPRLQRRFASIHREIQWQDMNRIRLGRMLFFEPLMSRNGKISCNSCHPLDRFGASEVRFPAGVDGRPNRRHAPSVYNSAGQSRFFWDGRAASLVEQTQLHLADAALMDMPAERLVTTLARIPGYRDAFADAFPGQVQPISADNAAAAIAIFERGLVTPSRWDRFLDGDADALTETEQLGAQLFANYGCLVCHTGAFVGGTMREKVGRMEPWPNQADRGLYETTRSEHDDMVFKVPSLRNVARIGPYFHDGSVPTLDAAVRAMARYQLGMYPSDREVSAIVDWLESMTGEIPADYIKAPLLPAAVRP